MQTARQNLFMRDDTFFGVCEALGEDFGFNANYLRVALGVSLLLSPVAMIGAYAAGAVVVMFSRLVAPNPRFAKASAGEPARAQIEAPRSGDNDAQAEALAAAA
ncbi:MAG TPA: PspC domain-containing protein [Allosphingosinicella sp.]|nr:PspC domain-containing protein [Allosphingosinicella sp.]